ncbi:M23 family metallopeptidase [Frigoribacterium sp. CFBP 8751]|uniref:M23 family metallopeptidase n=1 Tax=Frigoribacterium sp. CFBP 8751 TaxID=2775277 RepID=UPI00177D1D41|nr:M23 family metallopeptidase [Frigoribacterium sp. CFBP 8751]MBD8540232.1 M23 family metallopeptidase [Frigoribacterium sp. CFBP 8751]
MTDPSNTPESSTTTEQTPRADPPLTRREARALERAAAGAAPAAAPAAAAPFPSSAAPPADPATADPATTDPAMNPVSSDAPTSNRVPGSEVGATLREGVAAEPATAEPATRVARRPRPSVPALLRRTRDAGGPSPRATPGRSRLRAVSSRVRAATLPVLGVCAVMLFFTSNLTPASASDLGGSNIPTAGAAPMPTQTLAASLVVLTVSDRDAFGVTDAPPPPPPPEPEPVVTSKNVAGSASSNRASSGAGTIVNSGTGDIRWPFPGSVVLSSGFGPRSAPCAACSSMHMGLDMTPGGGTPIGAAAAGVVRTSGMHGQFGQYAVIDHVIDGQRVSTLYAHMQVGSSPLVAGQTVQVGELVGKVGRSGVATGEHLHFEVLLGGTTQVDPKAWLDANAGRTL